MNAAVTTHRAGWQGVLEIVSFNWHWYAAGFIGISCIVGALVLVPMATITRTIVWLGLSVAVLWSAASLVVSHYVYDLSLLRKWVWVRKGLSTAPHVWCQIHCGLDESSLTLRRLFPEATGAVLDIFDPAEMTEPSIARARRANEASLRERANFRHLPFPECSLDAVFLIFAAHEIRERESRAALFSEVRRVLRDGGEVIVAEHLRDIPNFCAFGPGVFHFFSCSEWRRSFDAAGLATHREFTVTPFVRVFVLRRAS